MLPEAFLDQPLLWRQREIEALGYPEVWRALEAQRGEVDRLASLLLQHPSSSWVTRPVLVWALLCVYRCTPPDSLTTMPDGPSFLRGTCIARPSGSLGVLVPLLIPVFFFVQPCV